jgi:hypothetical protein
MAFSFVKFIFQSQWIAEMKKVKHLTVGVLLFFSFAFGAEIFLSADQTAPQYENQFMFIGLGGSNINGHISGLLGGLGYRWEKGKCGQDFAIDCVFSSRLQNFSLKYQCFYRFARAASSGLYLGPATKISIYKSSGFFFAFPCMTIGYKFTDRAFFEVNTGLDWDSNLSRGELVVGFVNPKLGIAF